MRAKVYYQILNASLNPTWGFLHKKEDRSYPYLVWDFSELWIAKTDTIIFNLLNRKMLDMNGINKSGRLNQENVLKIINEFEKKILDKEIEKEINKFVKYIEEGVIKDRS